MLFFLSKNFRSYSSLGFLSSDGGKSFRLAAVISQASDKVLQGVELFHNQGLVGKSSKDRRACTEMEELQRSMEYTREALDQLLDGFGLSTPKPRCSPFLFRQARCGLLFPRAQSALDRFHDDRS